MNSDLETNLVVRAVNSVRSVGIRHTVEGFLSLVEDHWFERWYRLDSVAWVDREGLGVTDDERKTAQDYKPSRRRHFRRLIAQLELPANSVLVDFGAGKGHLLLAAAQLGFERVVGVELSARLCAIARQNLAAMQRRDDGLATVQIVEANAVAYVIQPDENVFYFYNPFTRPVMMEVLANIGRSLTHSPRPVWIIYNNPVDSDLLTRDHGFSELLRYRYGGSEAVVYWRARGTDESIA